MNAYEENPEFFPNTDVSEIEKYFAGEGREYDSAAILQEKIHEAEYGTLKHYLTNNWDSHAIDICLNKLEKLTKKHKESVPYKRIETEEDFLKHDRKYNKRWNLPVFEYCLNNMNCENKYTRYLKSLDIEEFLDMQENLTKITREFSPRNVLVDGEKLTFDTELYGPGIIFLEYGGMISQLLEDNLDYANKFLEHIEKKYGESVGKHSMLEVIGYRLTEIYKCKNDMGDKRKKYHIGQLEKLVDMYREKYD